MEQLLSKGAGVLRVNALDEHGFAIVPAVVDRSDCATLARQAEGLATDAAGTRRLLAQPWCAALAARLREHPILREMLPPHAVAVQCTFFTKSAETNWLVAVHQDLAIPVAERVESPELRGWSEKEGEVFVQAPAGVLESLVAVRLHLDPCGPDDGPLQVVPGSHRQGIIAAREAVALRREQGTIACTADPGDALVMRPLLLHASSKAKGTSLRRVLHFVFGPRELPHGLRWRRN
jgi:hypothetical protein